VDPVKQTKSVLSMSGPPTTEPWPYTTWNNPSGSPASASRSAAHSAVNGVWLSGLRTTALPASSAGMASEIVSTSG
jgi:hypothetical protein